MFTKLIAGVSALLLLIALVPQSWTFAQDAAAGPRPGKYNILSYGASTNPPLFLGHFELEKSGVYKSFLPGGRQVGEGMYEFDAAKMEVIWKTGPFVKDWPLGKFFTVREGKTHKIQLRRTTYASNNIDGGN